MGLFLQTAIIQNCNSTLAGASIKKIENMLQSYDLNSMECKYKEQDNCVQILFNENSSGYEKLAECLSKEVGRPVLLLYIYDGDYWGYYFYNNGEFLDAFNPIPDYFGDVSDEEREKSSGNSAIIAQYFKIDEAEIKDYLVEWTAEKEENFEDTIYEDDEFGQCEDWQLADFMKKLGYLYWDGNETITSIPKQQAPTAEQQHVSPISKPYSNDNNAPLPNALDSDYIYSILNANRLYQKISKAFCCGEYKTAIEDCTKLIEKSPDESSLYVLRAYCNKGLRKKPEMERDLENALQHSPSDIMILRARCPVIATVSRYRRHIGDLTKLMELDVEHYNNYLLSRAWRYHWVGDDGSARSDMKELLKRDIARIPDFTVLYESLGME